MKFLDIFPIPKYLAMPAYGVDFSDHSFKYLRFREGSGGIRIADFGQTVMPEGIIEKGEIKNAKELSIFLKKNCGEHGIGHVATSLPDEKSFLSIIKLPKMSKEFLRGAIESQLEEYIPLSANETIFDYEIIHPEENSKEETGAKEETRVVVMAYHRSVAESYRDAFYGAGITPLSFETEFYALRRAVLPTYHRGTEMIVDFGRTHTSFIIVHNGIVRFNSTILVAGDSLNEALRKRFSLDYIEAERMKKEKGMLRTKENMEVFNAILPIAAAIAEEIQRHIIYWNSHAEHLGLAHRKGIEMIKLAGGETNLLGFADYLEYELKLPVRIANPWLNVSSFDEYIPEIAKNESLIYANVVGLALGALREL